jgi:hypothetical protein
MQHFPSRTCVFSPIGFFGHYGLADARMVKKSAPIENRKDLESPHGGVNLTLSIGLHVS